MSKNDDVEIIGTVDLGSGLPAQKRRKIPVKGFLWIALVLAVVGLLVLFLHFRKSPSGPAARVATAPPVSEKDTVGVSQNPEYQRKVSILNEKVATTAEKTGQSAMATVGGLPKTGDTLSQPKPLIQPPSGEGRAEELDRKTRLKMIETARSTESILIAKQVGSILGTWSSAGSGLAVLTVKRPAVPGAKAGGKANGSKSSNPKKKVPIIPAGKILYGRIVNELNSDRPGTPVLAEIVGGRFDGVKLLGSFQLENAALVVRFDQVVYRDGPGGTEGTTDSIGAFAVSPGAKLRSGLASDVDNHYLYRYGALLASAFMQGFGQSAMYANSTSYPSAMGTPVIGFNGMTIEQQTEMGLGQAGMMLSGNAQNAFNIPPTVKLYANTPIGIMIVAETGQKMPTAPAPPAAKVPAPATAGTQPAPSMVPQPGYPQPTMGYGGGYGMPMMPMMP